MVGAGPGDPDLLTVRAAAVLSSADVVMFDRLVDDRIVALAPPRARLIDVGKVAYAGTEMTQAAINATLIELGRGYGTVVRLKGGDPFIFGRGGEELAALRAAGVDVVVVPGITSAVGVPTLAGVPLTTRGLASSFLVVSGHDLDEVTAAVEQIRTTTTLVLLMAVANRSAIASRLLALGWDSNTPVALIAWGATRRERRVLTALEHLAETPLEAPAVIVIGKVAALMRPEERAAMSPQAYALVD